MSLKFFVARRCNPAGSDGGFSSKGKTQVRILPQGTFSLLSFLEGAGRKTKYALNESRIYSNAVIH